MVHRAHALLDVSGAWDRAEGAGGHSIQRRVSVVRTAAQEAGKVGERAVHGLWNAGSCRFLPETPRSSGSGKGPLGRLDAVKARVTPVLP